MSEALIRAAFETRLTTWAASRSLPIFFENVTGSPAKPYVRVNLLPAETENQFLDGTHRLRVGVCQVSLVMPPNTGTGAAAAHSASLDAAFPLTVPLTQGSARVFLTAPFGAGIGVDEDDAYFLPVTCRYRCDTVL